MKTNARLIILVLVIMAVGVIFVMPYLDATGKAPDKFALTERPIEKLDKALQAGRPVFLEFYSYT